MRNLSTPIEIVCNIDDRYARQCAVMLTSLLENNPGEFINIHLVFMALSEANREMLSAVVQRKYGCRMVSHPVDEMMLQEYHVGKCGRFGATAFLRCLVPSLLSPSIHKALYLDSDMVVLGSVRPLWEVDIDGNALAAVEDGHSADPEPILRLRLPDNYVYFNTGVLLMNLDYWRDNNVLKKLLLYLEGFPERIRACDCDLLNVCLWRSRVLLPLRWNMQSGFLMSHPGCSRYAAMKARTEIPCSVIAHFSGKHKPWQNNCVNPFKEFYDKYLDMTEFPGERPDKPGVSRLYRACHKVGSLMGVAGAYRHTSIAGYGHAGS